MSKIISSGLLVAAVVFATACQDTVKLDSDVRKTSYAIGQQFGGNLKQNGIAIDTAAMAMAFADVAAGKNQLSQEDMKAAMVKLQETAMKKEQAVAEGNGKAGSEFLEKNKSNPGVKVTQSGLQYIVESEGSGPSPKKDDMVRVHYQGNLITGEKFDSSYDRGEPVEFQVGGVIAGWTEALQLMKVGAKYKLFIPARLAYGTTGRPGIPPNSVLVFQVELKEIVKQGKKK